METIQPRQRESRPVSFFIAWFLVLLLMLSAGLNVLLFFVAIGSFLGGGALPTDGMVEVAISGSGSKKLLLLRVEGVIQQGSISPWGTPTPDTVEKVRRSLDRARHDDDIAGVLLQVNSPGGGVTASDLIYDLIRQYKADTGYPVVAHFGDLAASGGYYISMAADRIVAHPTSTTGSIGVIVSILNLAGLLERYDVEEIQITPGDTPLKGMGSPMSPMKPEERAVLQSLVEDMYRRFVDLVVLGRPGLERPAVEKLADGSIYSADRALENGLVDQIGYRRDALQTLLDSAKLGQAKLIEYRPQPTFLDMMFSRVQTPSKLEIQVGPEIGASEGPMLQYLWNGWRR